MKHVVVLSIVVVVVGWSTCEEMIEPPDHVHNPATALDEEEIACEDHEELAAAEPLEGASLYQLDLPLTDQHGDALQLADLRGKVVVVDEFVNKNCDKMAETELFKMAGLVYEDKVVGPARAEGVPVPRWDWKSIAVHYQFHRIDVRYRRIMNIRGLGEVQKMLQLSMTRIDENGDQQVDPQTHDRFIKTYKEHSREISLLQEANLAARPRGAR